MLLRGAHYNYNRAYNQPVSAVYCIRYAPIAVLCRGLPKILIEGAEGGIRRSEEGVVDFRQFSNLISRFFKSKIKLRPNRLTGHENHGGTRSRNGQASHCRRCCASQTTEVNGQSSQQRGLSVGVSPTMSGRRGELNSAIYPTKHFKNVINMWTELS